MNQEQIYKEYKKLTNMDCAELKKWKNDSCSKKASIGTAAINRNLRLQCKKKSQWTKKDFEEAQKSISYLKRSAKIKRGKLVKGCNLTKNEIARRNWARK